MANPIYAVFKDNNGSVLPGQVTKNPDKDRSARTDVAAEVIALEYEMFLPVDEFSGQINSKRKHKDFVITIDQDAVTPYFYLSMADHWKFQSIDLEFWSADKAITGGTTVGNSKFFTITLERATVTSIKAVMADTKHVKNAKFPHMVEVGFRAEYQKWLHEDGAIFAECKDLSV